MRALIVVDMQKDFCEGGALAVQGGLEVADRIMVYLAEHAKEYDRIVFTRDWHNKWPDTNGGHFSETPDYKNSWPVHCEQYSEGAQLVRDFFGVIPTPNDVVEIFKGQGRPDYSGFQGVTVGGRTIGEVLPSRKYDFIDVCGLAFDYCVAATARSAINYSPYFRGINIITELTAGISREAELAAANELGQLGVRIT